VSGLSFSIARHQVTKALIVSISGGSEQTEFEYIQNFLNFLQAELYLFQVDLAKAAEIYSHRYAGSGSGLELTGRMLAGERS